jgi:type IV secretory pathway ATPase VirB11/archaellum biosynthesis ATPase
MSLKLTKLTHLQEKENFEGKKKKLLIIDCDNCTNKNNELKDLKKCFLCFLKNLYLNRNQKLSEMVIKRYNATIERIDLKKYLKFFKLFNKLKKNWNRIPLIKRKYCLYENFNCKLSHKDTPPLSTRSEEFLNPFLIFIDINERIKTIDNTELIDPICQKCSYKIRQNLVNLLNLIENLEVIRDFKEYSKQNDNLENYYRKLISPNETIILKNKKLNEKEPPESENLIKIYKVGDYNLFEVHIYEIAFEYEKRYIINFLIDRSSTNNYQLRLIEEIASKIHIPKLDQILPLETLIERYNANAIEFINGKYNFDKLTGHKIAFLTALHKIRLLKLFPLLIDDKIEEIFLDSPIDRIYINHQDYGRCRTDIYFTLSEIERIKTLLRLYSGKRLDFSNPSLKYILKNKYFYCRFAIDIDPVHSNKFGMSIRKLNKNIFNIQDLLKVGSLNSMMAAFLFFCILRRANITVTGETDTGKTTLINALDLIAPKEFRKIYIEDITESLNQYKFDRHQLKFKVDSIESSEEKKHSKQNQIKSLLHRTPDLIYLGEILTKEEAEAMFHSLAAGLRGFQTIHSNDLNSLTNRFLYHFDIDRSCLEDLDLLVFMKKNRSGRKIISISEISDFNANFHELHKLLFSYNPQTLQWEQKSDLYKSKIIRKFKIFEDIPQDNFNAVISLYQKIFLFLKRIDKLSNRELISLFDKIKYFSFESYDALKSFWLEWKKNRSLKL